MPYIPILFCRHTYRRVPPRQRRLLRRLERHLSGTFFGEQAEWCKKYNVEYLVHLNHEETMVALERSEGDYFRDNR